MIFENLAIERVIIHEVYERADDRTIVPPKYGTALVNLDQNALDALRDRVISSMGSASKSMETGIIQSGDGSAVACAKNLIDADDVLFIENSKEIVNKLVSAQSRKGLPGGILVVFSASVGYPSKRMIGLIKAETHTGFTRQQDSNGTLMLKFLKDLILTPQTKLYKIGAFVEMDPSANPFMAGWKAMVYDDLMTPSNRYNAAQYFYEGFLGCGFPESSARLTKSFHDLTKAFIRKLDIPEERKLDLNSALITYLKVDQAPTVGVAAFAQAYLAEPEMRDAYSQYMQEKEFPQNAVAKDLADVAGELKQRKVMFANNIRLVAPADKFKEYIRMKAIDGEADEHGQIPRWTEIIVRDHIRDLARWVADKPIYQAWSDHVTSTICDGLLLAIEPRAIDAFLKVPAIPRLKAAQSLVDKALHRGKKYTDPYSDITDKAGVRFVVLLTSDIKKVEEAIKAADWEYSKDKDYEEERMARPLEFAYQSVHYVIRAKHEMSLGGVKVPVGISCEVQVRTLLQHAHSELTHDTIYKPKTTASPHVHRTVAKSMALIEATDEFFEQVAEHLDEATQFQREALKTLVNLYREKVGLEPENAKSNLFIVDSFSDKLGDGFAQLLRSFLETGKPYVIEKVKTRAQSQHLFRQPAILLVYFLASSSPAITKERWPLIPDDLRIVFGDIGLSYDGY